MPVPEEAQSGRECCLLFGIFRVRAAYEIWLQPRGRQIEGADETVQATGEEAHRVTTSILPHHPFLFRYRWAIGLESEVPKIARKEAKRLLDFTRDFVPRRWVE